jgi:serine/threonine protein kinase
MHIHGVRLPNDSFHPIHRPFHDFSQDLHPDNILCNHEDRHRVAQHKWEPGMTQPPFQSTFDCQLAFIDFGSAIRFPPNVSDHIVRNRDCAPPVSFRAPEQPPNCHGPYDIFAADVYSLGKILQYELAAASKVGKLEFNFDSLPRGKAAQKLPPAGSDTKLVCPAYLSLLGRMTIQDPSDRPIAMEALEALGNVARAPGRTE